VSHRSISTRRQPDDHPAYKQKSFRLTRTRHCLLPDIVDSEAAAVETSAFCREETAFLLFGSSLLPGQLLNFSSRITGRFRTRNSARAPGRPCGQNPLTATATLSACVCRSVLGLTLVLTGEKPVVYSRGTVTESVNWRICLNAHPGPRSLVRHGEVRERRVLRPGLSCWTLSGSKWTPSHGRGSVCRPGLVPISATRSRQIRVSGLGERRTRQTLKHHQADTGCG
jgi:hypothetical protein